jgi:signal recognition particle subunit SEC65
MVPKRMAVEEPTCDELMVAARACGYEGAVDADAAYPGEWHKAGGRVQITRQGSKAELLRKVSSELKRLRQK